MKRISIFALLVLTVMEFGAAWVGSTDAAEPALSKAIFYVG